MDEHEVEVYLTLNKKEFDSVRNRASQESIDSDVNDEEMKEDLLFKEARININDLYVEDKSDEIQLNGDLVCFGKTIGWIDLKIPINAEMGKDVIERFIKKLQKLKTVLEATRD